jgi:hypothetical protein
VEGSGNPLAIQRGSDQRGIAGSGLPEWRGASKIPEKLFDKSISTKLQSGLAGQGLHNSGGVVHMKRRSWLFALAGLFLCASQSFAQTLQYEFDLSGANEAPPVVSGGTGTALVTIDLGTSMMRVEASFSGLNSLTSAAHIHCCDFDANGNAGVATQTPSFPGFPLDVTMGAMDQTFDMTLASSYRAGFLTANGSSTATAFNSLLAGLDSGQAYFNIHTDNHPSGEIRGFADLIPEPASAVLALFAIGLTLLRRPRQAR